MARFNETGVMSYMSPSKHEFAVYIPGLSSQITSSKQVLITDADIVHRIRSVLRLVKGQDLIFFDEKMHVASTLMDVNKKTVSAHIIASECTKPLTPSITFLLPLLKREAFERMIYACVELGANSIQLVSTEKSQSSWRGEKELQRIRSIMIAAAEQSKQFVIPVLHGPRPLSDVLSAYQDAPIKLVADPAGAHLYEVLTQIHAKIHPQENAIVITMGPEGDLTDAEKTLLREASYQAVKLTPTILRSQQAGALLLGVIRSTLY